MPLNIKEILVPGYERVIEGICPEAGLHCFIAVHNTSLGPALGGTRFYPYSHRDEALVDALRLAKAMTYKSAICENGLGGGKGVIIADPRIGKTESLLLAYAEVINSLQGLYIAAEDVGTNTEDMVIIRKKTPYVAALPSAKSSGDPSRFTAWGVYKGMQAVAKYLWQDKCLRKKKIAIQGLGNVGSKLANILFWEGADLIISDIDNKKTEKLKILYGAEVVSPEKILTTPCDILSPCSLGGIIHEGILPLLHCQVIAGSANNQLLTPQIGWQLHEKNILYAPDYVINAGGVMNSAEEFDREGYDPKRARDRVNHIYDFLLSIFISSKKEGKSTSQLADELSEYKLQHLIGKRKYSIQFH